jgi:hypothetical protein
VKFDALDPVVDDTSSAVYALAHFVGGPLVDYTGYSTRYVHGRCNEMSVRHALLALLAEGPAFGLRLQQEFESRNGEVWPLNVGQVYKTLQRLERDGLVVSGQSEGGGAQKDYDIT